MINTIQLFGALILTIVGFIVPLLTILISIFPDGVKLLASKYENEKNQSDENIANETAKREKTKGLDYKALEKTLRTLQNKKREAETKLSYLKPKEFIFRTSTPFIIALVAVFVALVLKGSTSAIIIVIASSLISFIAGIMVLLTSISILFEVAEIVNQKKTSDEERIIALLSEIAQKPGEDPFLKEGEIKVEFNRKSIKKDAQMDFSVDKKHKIPIHIHNSSNRMAKTVEVGFRFPKDVVIEKNALNITTTEEEQIVRFKESEIQAHNNNSQGNLEITFLKAQKTPVTIFIKGENVKYESFVFNLNIVS